MNKNNKIFNKIFFVVSVISFFYLIFSKEGIIKYFNLKNKNKKLSQEIEKLDQKSQLLLLEEEKLKNDLKYIEKIAREEFGMAKKGEKIFLVKKGQKVQKVQKGEK